MFQVQKITLNKGLRNLPAKFPIQNGKVVTGILASAQEDNKDGRVLCDLSIVFGPIGVFHKLEVTAERKSIKKHLFTVREKAQEVTVHINDLGQSSGHQYDVRIYFKLEDIDQSC